MQPFSKYIISRILLPLFLALLFIFIVGSFKHKITDAEFRRVAYKGIEEYRWVEKVSPVEGYILGSSSLKYGLSAKDLQGNHGIWINFANDARDPILSDLLLETYYEYNKPSRVVIGLDPWIFSRKYYKYENPLIYLDLNPVQTLRYFEIDKGIYFTKTQILISTLFSGLSDRKATTEDLTVVPENFGSTGLKSSPMDSQTIHFDWFEISRYGWSELQFEHIDKIVKFCDSKKIKVCFVIPPKRSDFISWQRSNYKKEHDEWWQLMVSRFKGYEIVGQFATLPASKERENFVDAIHLSPAGQTNYTIWLKSALSHPDVINGSYDIFGSTN